MRCGWDGKETQHENLLMDTICFRGRFLGSQSKQGKGDWFVIACFCPPALSVLEQRTNIPGKRKRGISSPATEMGRGTKRKAEHDADDSVGVGQDASNEGKKRRSSAATNADKDATSTKPMRQTPHIPAPVWGHVLDYMPYGEVRQMLLVGKTICTEAVKYVQTINIMNSWEMDAPAARRFANVTDVNILSLLRFHTEDEEVWQNDFYLCGTTAERTVPFIVGFEKLRRIRAGGLDADKGFLTYDTARWKFADLVEADDSGEILRALVTHFLGALSTRLLPTTVESLLGITAALKYIRPCRSGGAGRDDPPNPCKYCRKTLKFFPIKDLIVPFEKDFTCFSSWGELSFLAERQGFKERCREISEVYLIGFIESSLIEYFIDDNDLCERLQKKGVTAAEKQISYLNSNSMTNMDRLIEFGFDPKSVSYCFLRSKLLIGWDGREFDVYDKSTFEFLASRGIPLDKAELVLIDKTKEPGLKELRDESN